MILWLFIHLSQHNFLLIATMVLMDSYHGPYDDDRNSNSPSTPLRVYEGLSPHQKQSTMLSRHIYVCSSVSERNRRC